MGPYGFGNEQIKDNKRKLTIPRVNPSLSSQISAHIDVQIDDQSR